MKFDKLQVNGEEIFYREKGEKDVLLLLHGNMTSSVFFTEMIEDLSRDYRVIAPDLRSYGESSYNKKVKSIRDFEDDMREFILKLDLRDITVLGWSLGGGVVMELLSDDRVCDRIKKAILLSSIGVCGARVPVNIGKNIGLELFNSNMTMTGSFARYDPMTSFLEHSNEQIRYKGMDGLLRNLVYTNKMPDPEIYERNLKSAAKQKSLAEAGRAVVEFSFEKKVKEVPMLIIHGNGDKVIDIMVAELNRDYFNAAKFVVFENCGHAAMTDRYEELISEIRRFCQ